MPVKTATNVGERVELLARIPMFSAFTREELASLAPRFIEVSHGKGVVLFNEGDEGGDFFVVARGELEVWGGGATKRVVNRLGPGDHLGEIALLLVGRRTATVRVSRAVRLLTMGAAEFHELIERHPKVLTFIVRNLSRQLVALTRGEVAQRSTLTIGVSGASGLKGRTLISNSIAALLARQGDEAVLVIDVAGRRDAANHLDRLMELGDDALGSVRRDPSAETARLTLATPGASSGWSPAGLTALVDGARERFPLIVLDLGSHETAPPRLLGEVCDVIVELVAQPDDTAADGYGPSTRVLRVVNLHNRRSKPFAVNRCEPFLLRDDPGLRRLDPLEQAAHIRDQPRSPASPALHRLARKVHGASVGIALAAGAAFGISHIGVLQVLEEGGVPLDMITGTSMGSITGALYATGISARELAAVMVRTATKRKALSVLDPSLARPGLLAGNRLTAILRELGLKGGFEDLALPYQAMATDIETGERVPIGTGELSAACRASASIPGVFAPVRRDGRILVDGGVVDQVPIDLLRDMGADVCIAVTVIPTLQRDVRTVFTRVSNRINAINPLSYLAGARGMPTTVDLVMNALQMLQYQLASFEALSADAQLEVDTSDFTWIDFHRAAALIERGAQTAEQALPQIQRLLAERPVLAA
jgi:NTE family protein